MRPCDLQRCGPNVCRMVRQMGQRWLLSDHCVKISPTRNTDSEVNANGIYGQERTIFSTSRYSLFDRGGRVVAGVASDDTRTTITAQKIKIGTGSQRKETRWIHVTCFPPPALSAGNVPR